MLCVTRRGFGVLAASAALLLGVAGCGGSSSGTSFAGSYQGSGLNSSGMFSISLSILGSGAVSGTATQLTGGSTTSAIAGTCDPNGNLVLAWTSGGTTTNSTGTLTAYGNGVVSSSLTISGAGTVVPVYLTSSTSTVVYTGSYTGTYLTSANVNGTAAITVSSSGGVTGTVTPSGGAASTVTGSITSLGAASLTLTPATGSATQYSGAAAYDVSGRLLVTVTAPATGSTLSFNLAGSTAFVRRAATARN